MTDISFEDLPSEEPVTGGDDAPPGLLVCEECGKEAKNARGLSMHMKRTHGIGNDGESKTSTGSGRRGNLEKELTEFFVMIAMMVSMVNPTDGTIIGGNAERLAHAYANLARQNKPFRRFLEGMMKTGAIGEVFTATLITAIPILSNHGKIPKELGAFFGMPPMSES